ncbi:NADP-dependent malic enzyme [Candidatus Pacearchaeota archaeon]|nr:NADP-dependent malic enzyme [Candidatus Pacearchaeota archaeon]
MDIKEDSLKLHEKLKGKFEIKSKHGISSKEDLSLLYTPGVAEPCIKISENKEKIYDYTIKGNSVAVISDGSSVLGLGNIGAESSLPVMEGKAVLFKEFANIDAFPICLKEQNVKKTIETIKNISVVFGGINLEDFKAPECFEIESSLQDLGIPVMHDDQHGTSVVVLAALINSFNVVKKKKDAKIVVNGAGAAGTAITKLLFHYGFKNILVCDTQGIIHKGRNNLNSAKKEVAEITNKNLVEGDLRKALENADVFIGVSKGNLLNSNDIKKMNHDAIVFAMANPTPEIMPDEAKKAGARIVATGRSDFPNQINNVLAFPGIFRGALDVRAKKITTKMKVAAAEALANLVIAKEDKILPSPLDKSVVPAIAEAVKKAWLEEK